ncbi:hypothetical protein H9L13_10330 [Sphingomonas lutea]|uniref:Uncharacterized protein n=1 Tax=Sphingomonas lutea TaxID=1045317 RepID=A0A7G9SGP8_9SPHN|nr:hypothetical protein [Sphingomonas lutea]QNN67023.1 hypothetical protein H9L13_10330 [Sphingomonas lutea]
MIELPSWSEGQQAIVRTQTPSGIQISASAIVRSMPPTVLRGTNVTIDGRQVVGKRQPAIVSPDGGDTVDLEARAALKTALDAMRSHGLIES